MQTASDSNAIDFIQRHATSAFWTIASLSLVLLITAFIYKIPEAALLPFALLFGLLTLLNFRIVFYIMLCVMPFSIEYTFGSLGLDIPSEPIVMLLCVCTVIYLVYRYDLLRNAAFQHVITTLIVLQFLWSGVAAIYSANLLLSVKYLLAKFWYITVFFVLPLLFIKTEKDIHKFFWCVFIPTFCSVCYVMVRHALYGFTFDTITQSVHPIYRNHVNYAVFITMIFPFIPMAMNWYKKDSFIYKFLRLSIPLFITAIYFSFTRGAWLAFLAMGVYYLIMRFRLTKLVLVISAFCILIFSIYILHDNTYLKYAPNYENTIYHEELSEHLSSTFEMEDMSTVERFYRWIAAVHLFKKHPLTGVGPNNFVSQYKKYTVTAYETYISDNEEKSTVHNYFLLLLTEQGVPAFILFVLLIAALLITAENAYHQINHAQKKYVLAFTLCIVVFLINNSLSDLVEANKVGSLFYICAAVLVNLSLIANKEKQAKIS